MHEENTVSLKIYLMEGKNNVECRRFEVDHGVITNYDYMRERLQMAIPKIRGKIFKLLWQDADEDEVTISSDEELMIALSEMKATVCKFIVRLPANEEETDPFININIPTMHDLFSNVSSFANSCPLFTEMQGDVTCNSCQRAISGMRYKCLECAQYCHCTECENKNLHPDHVMLRISKTLSTATVIPKCMQILKGHLLRGGSKCAGLNTYFKDKMGHCSGNKEGEKEKCGSHHRRRFRKHGHCGGENKNTAQPEEPMAECPFNEQMFSNLGNVVGAFLGMYKDVMHKPKPSEAAATPTAPSNNSSEPIVTIDLDGPPMPAGVEDARMDEDNAGPSSATDFQKDAKIKMAMELLTEMGFSDENRWLSKLLEHFDGDISKTIDHLTVGK